VPPFFSSLLITNRFFEISIVMTMRIVIMLMWTVIMMMRAVIMVMMMRRVWI
jgi:hypothetical protein